MSGSLSSLKEDRALSFLAALGAAVLVLVGLCLFAVMVLCGLFALFIVAEAVLERASGGRHRDDYE